MPKENKKRRELPPEVSAALKDIVRSCEIEDDYIRHLQIKTWKKLEEFWHGIQFIFWSEIANDWMTPAQGLQIERVGEETRDEARRDDAGPNAEEAQRRDESGGHEEGRAGEG